MIQIQQFLITSTVQVFIYQGTGVGKEEKEDVDFAHKKASQSTLECIILHQLTLCDQNRLDSDY